MALISRFLTLMAMTVTMAMATAAGALAQDGLTLVRAESAGGAAEMFLSMEDLRALPQVTVNTTNDFKDGVNAYTGPLVRDVLAVIGRGSASKAHLIAANDYAVDIDLQEFDDYGVIFALEMNGEPFSLRDLGPIWLMYPITGNKELQDPIFNSRLIWQLVRMEMM